MTDTVTAIISAALERGERTIEFPNDILLVVMQGAKNGILAPSVGHANAHLAFIATELNRRGFRIADWTRGPLAVTMVVEEMKRA